MTTKHKRICREMAIEHGKEKSRSKFTGVSPTSVLVIYVLFVLILVLYFYNISLLI